MILYRCPHRARLPAPPGRTCDRAPPVTSTRSHPFVAYSSVRDHPRLTHTQTTIYKLFPYLDGLPQLPSIAVPNKHSRARAGHSGMGITRYKIGSAHGFGGSFPPSRPPLQRAWRVSRPREGATLDQGFQWRPLCCRTGQEHPRREEESAGSISPQNPAPTLQRFSSAHHQTHRKTCRRIQHGPYSASSFRRARTSP